MVTQQAPPKRKRGRPSNASKAAEAAARGEGPDEDEASRPRKRGRPRKSDTAPAAPKQPRTTGGKSVANLLRGPNPNPRVAMDERGEASTTQRGARPSLRDVAPAEAQNKTARRRSDGAGKRGARRSTGTRTTGTTARKTVPQPQSGPGAVPRRADPESPDDLRRRDAAEEEESDNQDYPPSPPKSYPHVAPHIRRVRQSTIETKWSNLGRGSVKALTAILQLAHRPILERMSNSQRREHTAAGLRLITERITRKIDRLPFPPASLPTRIKPGRPRGGRVEQDGGRETELNFESVLDAKQTLERQLDPVLHAVELLDAEVKRMEAEVERDYETLRSLEAGARAQARENKSLLRNAHPLAPAAKKTEGERDDDADILFENADDGGNPFEDIHTRELRSVVAQLGQHTDSLLADHQQTAGVSEQIAHSRASLQALLAQRLSPEEYERVVLGT